MSYKTRYTARWDSEKFGHDYRVEILERDYTGEAEVKRLGASPVLRMDDGENGVRGTSLELSVQADRDGELTTLYTTDNRRFRVEGKDVLEVYVAESDRKPVCALDESNRPWAYVRIADENILASAVHLEIWKNAEVENAPRVVYTGEEKKLLEVLDREGKLTLNQCSRKSGLERRVCTRLLADFIRFELVEVVFVEHTFYFINVNNTVYF